jgi:hypothetical protein
MRIQAISDRVYSKLRCISLSWNRSARVAQAMNYSSIVTRCEPTPQWTAHLRWKVNRIEDVLNSNRNSFKSAQGRAGIEPFLCCFSVATEPIRIECDPHLESVAELLASADAFVGNIARCYRAGLQLVDQ